MYEYQCYDCDQFFRTEDIEDWFCKTCEAKYLNNDQSEEKENKDA